VISGRPADDAFASYIRSFKNDPPIKGLRQVLHGKGTPRGYCLEPKFIAGVRLLGELGLSFDLCVRSEELLDAGMVTEEEARSLPAKNLVTRALGAGADIEPEIHNVDVLAGDIILLCSDGLTEMVGSYEIEGLLSINEEDMHETARRLVDLANESGGRDNISVIVVRVSSVGEMQVSAAAIEVTEGELVNGQLVPG
jgi:hypothetical protein